MATVPTAEKQRLEQAEGAEKHRQAGLSRLGRSPRGGCGWGCHFDVPFVPVKAPSSWGSLRLGVLGTAGSSCFCISLPHLLLWLRSLSVLRAQKLPGCPRERAEPCPAFS